MKLQALALLGLPCICWATPDPLPQPDRWPYWLGIGLLAALAVITAGRRYYLSTTPPVKACLRDVGEATCHEVIPIEHRAFRIGRDRSSNHLALPFETVSHRHAEIRYRSGGYYVRDRRSLNGTALNGEVFSDRRWWRQRRLKNGDTIRFDAYAFQFAVGGVPLPAERPLVDEGRTVPPGFDRRPRAARSPRNALGGDATQPPERTSPLGAAGPDIAEAVTLRKPDSEGRDA